VQVYRVAASEAVMAGWVNYHTVGNNIRKIIAKNTTLRKCFKCKRTKLKEKKTKWAWIIESVAV